jgi:hypothetical protein
LRLADHWRSHCGAAIRIIPQSRWNWP